MSNNNNIADALVFERERQKAIQDIFRRLPHLLHQARSSVHRGLDGEVLSPDPVQREQDRIDAWNLRFHADETPEEKALRKRAAAASRGMDATNQWRILLGDEQLKKDMEAARQFREAGQTRTWGPREKSPFDVLFKETNNNNNQPSQTPPLKKVNLETENEVNPAFASNAEIAETVKEIPKVNLFGPEKDVAPSTFGQNLPDQVMAMINAPTNALLDLGSLFGQFFGVKPVGSNYLTNWWDNFMKKVENADGPMADLMFNFFNPTNKDVAAMNTIRRPGTNAVPEEQELKMLRAWVSRPDRKAWWDNLPPVTQMSLKRKYPQLVAQITAN